MTASAFLATILCGTIAARLVQRPVVMQRDAVAAVDGDLLPSARLASAPYPAWAHAHQVWLSSGHNQSSQLQLIDDYLAHDIPVGGLDIDSDWSTGVNNFVFDVKKFPNATLLVQQMHQLGVRVVLWATSVIDTDSPNHAEGQKNGYYLNDGFPLKWWHGYGSWLDYTNPAAVAWWHKQMDLVLDIGIDGWKCDGTDPFIFEYELFGGIRGHAGAISERDYANAYYRDFFYYTRTKNPDALTWARPVNDYWHFAPHDVMFSGWVGDNDPTFDGMQWALNDMLHSAWANYLNFGSDTGGYRGSGPKPFGRTKELMIRWSQLSAFTPHFENGGDNEHRPWAFDNTNQTVDIYRTFVVMHNELAPFLLAGGAVGFAQNKSQITPLGVNLGNVYPTSWDFLLGVPPNVFVSPITASGVTSQIISFPSGQWVDWFDNTTYAGGTAHKLNFPLERFPVYRRRGTLFPLDVNHPASLLGHLPLRHDDALTVLVHLCASIVHDTFTMAEWRAPGVVLQYTLNDAQHSLQLSATAYRCPVVWQLRGLVQWPATVTAKGLSSALRRYASCDQLATDTAANVVVGGWCVGDEAHGEVLVRVNAEHAQRGTMISIDGVVAMK